MCETLQIKEKTGTFLTYRQIYCSTYQFINFERDVNLTLRPNVLIQLFFNPIFYEQIKFYLSSMLHTISK